MANKTYADLPNFGVAYPNDIKDPKLGEVVFIRDEWLNDGESRDTRYVIVNVNEVSRRCYIECIDSNMILKPQSLVAFSMIERR